MRRLSTQFRPGLEIDLDCLVLSVNDTKTYEKSPFFGVTSGANRRRSYIELANLRRTWLRLSLLDNDRGIVIVANISLSFSRYGRTKHEYAGEFCTMPWNDKGAPQPKSIFQKERYHLSMTQSQFSACSVAMITCAYRRVKVYSTRRHSRGPGRGSV